MLSDMREPKVYQDARSSKWMGVFYAYKELKGWVRIRKSTGCSDKAKAKAVVAEWHRLATLAGAGGGITREQALESVNLILRLAGIPEVVETQTWAAYSAAWLDLDGRKKQKSQDSTASSRRAHVNTWNRVLGEERTRWPLTRFDGETMQRCYDRLIEEGRSPATAANVTKTVALIFKRAVAEGYCPRNPAALIIRSPDDIERTREIFTRDEERKITAWLEARREDPNMADWLTVHLLGAATGRRLQDCVNAARADFAVQGKGKSALLVWTLKPRKMRRQGKVEMVPVVGPAAEHLRKFVLMDGTKIHGEPCPLLCPVLAGRKNLSKFYIDILRASGVEVGTIKAGGAAGYDFTTKSFHSWRHTLSSRLAEAGVEKRLGKLIVGHESDKVHEDYTHFGLDTLAEALRKAV